MTGRTAESEQAPASPRGQREHRMRWAGLPTAVLTAAMGVISIIGVDVPSGLACPSNGRWWRCVVEWRTLPLQWMLPIAVAAAIVLLLPSTSLTTGAANRPSAWAWLGIGGLLALAPVPTVVAAMRFGGPYASMEGSVLSEVLSVVAGAAATLALIVGATAVFERARLDSTEGLTSTVALLSLGILGLVGMVAIVARPLPPAASTVPLALTSAAIPAALLLRRGRRRLAQGVLWCTFALALVYGVLIFLSIGLNQAWGGTDAGADVVEYAGFGVTLGILAATGLIALTTSGPDPHRRQADGHVSHVDESDAIPGRPVDL